MGAGGLSSAPLWVEILPTPEDAAKARRYADKAVAAAARRLATKVSRPPSVLRTALDVQIARNLTDKLAKGAPEQPFALTLEAAQRQVVDYELFKASVFVRSGVFPKRYFGYIDEHWDTAARERLMRKTVIGAVEVANEVLSKRKADVRITELEVVVTFIAEGGALLLTNAQVDVENIHPVLGVGLDDIAPGFAREATLVEALDRRLGTGLAELVDQGRPVGQRGSTELRGPPAQRLGPRLRRFMTFPEAIAGTVVMWVYEKERAARLLWRAERRRLGRLSAVDQFIFGSLVYNSGLVFSSRRVDMIRTFSTARYLAGVSQKNAQRRWLLPVGVPTANSRWIEVERRYPDQPTSWSAVYHILQRYGAYEAIRRFTAVFDEGGRYRRRR